MSQYNTFKKSNIYLSDSFENEFITFSNKYNFDKKSYDLDNSFLSIDYFILSEKINDKPNNYDESFNHNNIEDLIKPSQSNFDFSKQIEKSKQIQKQISINIIPKEYHNTIKTTMSRTKVENNINNENKINNAFPKEKKKKSEKKFLGRKRKGNNEKREHTKFKEDNKIRKIKSHFTKFIYRYLDPNISDKNKKLLKMKKCINEDIGREFNMSLMKMTLRELFIKFSKLNKGEKYISKLIDEIFKNCDQAEINKKLNKTYIEVLDIMKNNYLNEFKEEILKKEIKNGKNEIKAKEYVDKLVALLYGFKNWFDDKIPRKTKK